MFKESYQSGFLSILYSIGSKPLQIWEQNSMLCLKLVENGYIKRLTDQDIQSSVLEIMGTNVTTTFVTCPKEKNKTLGIKLPFLVMIIKNVPITLTQLKKYFTFEVQVLDDKNVRRRFRASNYQSTTRVKPFICTMPMRLDEGTYCIIQDGIKFNSTFQILLGGLMDPTISRLSEYPSMPTAELEEFTSLTDYIVKRNSHQNSSSSFPSKSNDYSYCIYFNFTNSPNSFYIQIYTNIRKIYI